MEFIENIKRKIGFYLLRQEQVPTRPIKVSNLADAKNIGILYDATQMETHNVVREFVRQLREEKKTVKALGFVDTKEARDFQVAKLEFDFFLKTDLNWYYMPGHHVVDNFCNESYDLLIDLTLEPVLPQLYVLTWSKAKCKVGRQDANFEKLYDIMINVEKKPDLKFLIQQVKHYLTIINNPRNA
ncbi:MAG: hypothetical protein K1X82_01935 [Bacteroidia bacterium]|nr:hypothetical protein [Bacteroidia bacterium]